MLIGDVARHVGIRASAVRYYERQGIFSSVPRRPNGYRQYDSNDVKVLLFTVHARALGITLKEITSLLKLGNSSEAL